MRREKRAQKLRREIGMTRGIQKVEKVFCAVVAGVEHAVELN